jgi:geranylgeranyl pyrophosphate synthase
LISRASGQIIRETLNGAGLPAPFVNLLLIPLSQPGKILEDPESADWPQLVGAVASAVGANEAAASRVAAAVEVFAAALDVLDEVEDGDSSVLVELAGLPQALNASSALLFIAQSILAELPSDGTIASDVSEFMSALAHIGIAATAGQHRDLAQPSNITASLVEALEISQAKSGSLTAGACRLGALLGTRDPELIRLYELFGRHFGTMLQLANDLHDAQRQGTKSDLARKNPTLPIAFFRRGLQNEDPGTDELHPDDVAVSGALHFTWVVIERERQRCREVIEDLASKGQDPTLLQSLIGSSTGPE